MKVNVYIYICSFINNYCDLQQVYVILLHIMEIYNADVFMYFVLKKLMMITILNSLLVNFTWHMLTIEKLWISQRKCCQVNYR